MTSLEEKRAELLKGEMTWEKAEVIYDLTREIERRKRYPRFWDRVCAWFLRLVGVSGERR